MHFEAVLFISSTDATKIIWLDRNQPYVKEIFSWYCSKAFGIYVLNCWCAQVVQKRAFIGVSAHARLGESRALFLIPSICPPSPN